MKELKCPKCGAIFTVDEADYASILNQVKNDAFDAEVDKRITELHKQQEAEQTAAILKSEQGFKDQLSAKNTEIASKGTEIVRLNEKLNSIAKTRRTGINSIVEMPRSDWINIRGPPFAHIHLPDRKTDR